MDFQQRDLEILKFVFASRVVTREQLERNFFADRHCSAAGKRLRKLVRYGYLNVGIGMFYPSSTVTKYYAPTEKTAEAVARLWDFEIDRPHIKSESPGHDIRMAELAIRLRRLPNFSFFVSENQLQSSSDLKDDLIVRDFVRIQSDGVLGLRKPNGSLEVYGIEMEVTPKSLDRYKDKLASYYRSGSPDGVLYFCGMPSIARLIVRADCSVCDRYPSIVHTVLEKDALAVEGKIIFQRDEVQTLVIS